MQKLLSLILSFSILFTSVSPSYAQVRQVGMAAKQLTKTSNKIPTLLKETSPKGASLSAMLGRNLKRADFYSKDLSKNLSTSESNRLQRQILSSVTRQSFAAKSQLPTMRLPKETDASVAQRILALPNGEIKNRLLRNEMVILGLSQSVVPEDLARALSFYRNDLKKAITSFEQIKGKNLQEAIAQKNEALNNCQAALADASALGLLGQGAEDATLLINLYEAAAEGPLGDVVTRLTARSLIRMQAYDVFNQWAAGVKQEGELWLGLAQYIRREHLPVQISASIAESNATPKELVDWLEQGSLVNGLNGTGSFAATEKWMSIGKNAGNHSQQEVAASASVQENFAENLLTKNPNLLEGSIQSPSLTNPTSQAPVLPEAPEAFKLNLTESKLDAIQFPKTAPVTEENLHLFRDQGLASKSMEATYPIHWEDKSTGKTLDVTFQFENQAAKEAFYERLDLEPDEYFVFDRGTGGIVVRKELTAEQRLNAVKPKERGFYKVFFEGGQKTPLALYKLLFAREMFPAFDSAVKIPQVMTLLSTYRADLRQILSSNLVDKYPSLGKYLNAKDALLDKATIELLETGEIMKISKDIAAELNGVLASSSGASVKVFKDDIGHWAQNIAGMAEGTFGTMGQANTSALGLLGISKGFLSNLPTALGQFGPAWAPFIGAWAEKYGTKKMLSLGQLLGTGGHLTAAASLTAGALGLLPPLQAFGGMVGGITINGVAGSILKQINPMIAKQRASDPVSSSATITDLNSWASVGGMYCYLFLPVTGALSWLLTGDMNTTLGTLAAMFGVAAGIPLTANILLHKSRIQNIAKVNAKQQNTLRTIGENLKFGFKSPFLRTMFLATAGGHFMGLGFNSGPGNFIKENISNPSLAMAVSFASIYLTVFAGRKLGATAMQKGFIGDKALAGLSGLIGVGMGAASLLPGLDFATRCSLFAAAGLGFSNWVNVLQSIELSRPENIGREAAVSSMYILARTSGMLTMLMGAFGDYLGASLGLPTSVSSLYALSMPLAAGTMSMLLNWKYITHDLWPTAKRWGISGKNWFKQKLGFTNGAVTNNASAPLQENAAK